MQNSTGANTGFILFPCKSKQEKTLFNRLLKTSFSMNTGSAKITAEFGGAE